MPTITIDDETIECEAGVTLLRVLPDDAISSPGHITLCEDGICGMCTVDLAGDVTEPTDAERSRLSADALEGTVQQRLACKTAVQGDLEVVTDDGCQRGGCDGDGCTDDG